MSSIIQNNRAIVLSREDRGERDVTLTLFTLGSGQKKLVARGLKDVKSKHSGSLLPGSAGEIWWTKGRSYDIFVNARTSSAMYSLDVQNRSALTLALDFTARMTRENESDPRLFGLLIRYIDNFGIGSDLTFVDFVIEALSFLGWQYDGERSLPKVGEFIEYHVGHRIPYFIT